MSDNPDAPEVDPREFVRAMLHISPEDAKKAREQSPAARKRKPPEGPVHDYGEDSPED
ncbi:MAG TPA: hypothetical protein VF557_14100 [Jatrophihabitans sp.]|jgi:hypothetical protein|uniref:hypothetical protein n=1 Tax=Jatrophihabitans sp. TaxID=1932789 RepID=UPI002EF8FABE